MMRLLPVALLIFSFASASPVGTDADFAALTVRPNGPEELDLATGVTTLPEGGEIVYRTENVTLTGSFIRFLEGDFIEVEEAVVAGAFGTLKAPELRFEVAAQTLRAAQGATYSGEELELMADTITLNVEADLAVLDGGVSSHSPDLSGARALIDLAAHQAMLVGPYTFADGPVTLRGDAGELLALRWDAAGALSAQTEVPAALRARFAEQLP
jgi:hypothetical protein